MNKNKELLIFLEKYVGNPGISIDISLKHDKIGVIQGNIFPSILTSNEKEI